MALPFQGRRDYSTGRRAPATDTKPRLDSSSKVGITKGEVVGSRSGAKWFGSFGSETSVEPPSCQSRPPLPLTPVGRWCEPGVFCSDCCSVVSSSIEFLMVDFDEEKLKESSDIQPLLSGWISVGLETAATANATEASFGALRICTLALCKECWEDWTMASVEDSITVTILFFASAREAADGQSSLQVMLQSSMADTKQLRGVLAEKFPRLSASVLDEDSVTLALNEEYVPMGEVMTLKDGDTVALIPPISGG